MTNRKFFVLLALFSFFILGACKSKVQPTSKTNESEGGEAVPEGDVTVSEDVAVSEGGDVTVSEGGDTDYQEVAKADRTSFGCSGEAYSLTGNSSLDKELIKEVRGCREKPTVDCYLTVFNKKPEALKFTYSEFEASLERIISEQKTRKSEEVIANVRILIEEARILKEVLKAMSPDAKKNVSKAAEYAYEFLEFRAEAVKVVISFDLTPNLVNDFLQKVADLRKGIGEDKVKQLSFGETLAAIIAEFKSSPAMVSHVPALMAHLKGFEGVPGNEMVIEKLQKISKTSTNKDRAKNALKMSKSVQGK